MKRTKGIPPLSPDATDDEMIEWTETYDLGARLDAGVSEIVEMHEPSQREDRTTELTLRLPSAMKAALQKLARRRTTNATTLARLWIAERLRQELKDRSL
ncbi:MAG: hypothetical protein HOP18_12180 [Deltaproteobacteria bacterium]|nr:hypothetical protein [Deltaproteobacteria bacterium]